MAASSIRTIGEMSRCSSNTTNSYSHCIDFERAALQPQQLFIDPHVVAPVFNTMPSIPVMRPREAFVPSHPPMYASGSQQPAGLLPVPVMQPMGGYRMPPSQSSVVFAEAPPVDLEQPLSVMDLSNFTAAIWLPMLEARSNATISV